MQSSSHIVVPEDVSPSRADRLLAELLPTLGSRSALAKLIRSGRVIVGDRPIRPSTVINPGDRVEFLPEVSQPALAAADEVPRVPILFEDKDVVVVDKPAGLVVHPGAGKRKITLMDMLVETRPEMIGVGEPARWGVVHRLDKDTSGVMVLAKTELAHTSLSAQFKEHSVHRVYVALIRGNPGAEYGRIDAGLGRHAKDRKRISTVTAKARPAVTVWRVIERLDGITLLQIFPQTGRTHQIRVHLASVGLPVLGDPVYGTARKKRPLADSLLKRALQIMGRQALHASVLGFVHPRTLRQTELFSPIPQDMAAVVELAAGSPSHEEDPPSHR